MTGNRGNLALVMGGGGARAAYQVGVLRHLGRKHPDLVIPILTGVSAGAINAAFLAAHTDPFETKAERLANVWCGLTPGEIFRVGRIPLARNVIRLGLRLLSGGHLKVHRTHAFLETAPLWALLEWLLGGDGGELPGIAANLRAGALRAVAITTSSYSTGQSITWIQGEQVPQWERAHRRSRASTLTVAHVMASAALPVLFPAIRIDGAWYGDGGILLTTPLAPAVHLGAERILAISTRYPRTVEEADRPVIEGYPPPAQIFGLLLNAIFLDLFDADALSIERVNRLIEGVSEEKRIGMRPVRLLMIRPSRDLGQLANEYEPSLPTAFRFMTRGLGTQQTRSNDLLSLLMFQPDYLTRLVELGEADAQARSAEIEEFVADGAG
ncbi:MAG TPA: patatin-like phospholipase family protein [Planctomycetota bacterium]|jgi:NTE family protein|nr:patatin-like phospholipase family protein [Planctomycetota bacterium]